mgnify:CR=1 FL=1
MQVSLSYLKSYKGMGTAELACVSGCTCEPQALDGTWETELSLQQILQFWVRVKGWSNVGGQMVRGCTCVGAQACSQVLGVTGSGQRVCCSRLCRGLGGALGRVGREGAGALRAGGQPRCEGTPSSVQSHKPGTPRCLRLPPAQVSRHRRCRVRITVSERPGAVAQRGHKVQLLGIMVSHFSGEF